MKKNFLILTALLVLVAGSMFAGQQPEKDIVDTAVSAGTFTTLVTAVQAAGLVDTLKSDGPFTVFAPSDEAFAKLPEGTIESLLKDTDKLAQILTFHVVAGKKKATDVVGANSLTTVQGQDLAIDTTDGVTVGGAKVLTTDILTTNGVIHVIDTVLIPQS